MVQDNLVKQVHHLFLLMVEVVEDFWAMVESVFKFIKDTTSCIQTCTILPLVFSRHNILYLTNRLHFPMVCSVIDTQYDVIMW